MIRYADMSDFEILKQYDTHISTAELENSIRLKRVLVLYDGEKFAGWLRFNLFWDNTPFLNMLYISEGERRKGSGSALMNFWEAEMKKAGFNMVLTSTLSDEAAQFFYRKIGYSDCGALFLPKESAEIIFYKELTQKEKSNGNK